ncbi:MAG TPA: hypothetical protein VMH85_17200 [Terriglobales bacterium]|nr:hypothetical protein [Terriglobales bacterium]
MKAALVFVTAVCLLIGTIPFAPLPGVNVVHAAPPADTSTSLDTAWPKTFEKNGTHIIVYQPQLKSWEKYRTLVADTAVAITPPDGKQFLGVISWSAETQADVASRSVFVSDIHVISSRFPSLDPAREAQVQEKISHVYPTFTFNTSLNHMIASLEKVNAPTAAAPLNTQVPSIFVSTRPAIVLMVEGKPILAPIQGLELQYVVNTNWDLFYDKSDYYLLSGKAWLKSKELSGPWTQTAKLPADLSKLPPDQNWDGVKKVVPPPAGASAPKVFFTEKPSELIVFRGAPVWSPISGSSLSYATNTENSVFLHKPDNQVYALLSGRWFRAGNIDAPWIYAGNDLPADFARISPGKPYSNALVSVPGTQQASDAVLLAQVPTTAVVNRAAAEASVKVVYTGEPQFVVIEGTTMYYAVNTQQRVIRIGTTYYLCYNAIWFVSTSPAGPWKTADVVPQVIYTIPPSSPVYNVTYVYVTNPTPTTVQTSYTSGYLGVFVLGMAVGACVVYGTGYYYPPYIYYGPRYPIYYPYPYTYGVATFYSPYTGTYGVAHAVYGPYASAGTAAWYNPTTGTYGRAVTYQNAYGGHTYAQAYNPWTGTYAATSQGHNQYAQWGSTVVQNGNNWAQAGHYSNANGTVAGFQTSKGSAGAAATGKNGNSGFVAKDANNNNVYAGADGNVYKKDSSGNWEKWDNGGWQPVDPSTGLNQTKNSAKNSNNQNLSGATDKNSGNNNQNLSGATNKNQGGSAQNQPGANSRASGANNGNLNQTQQTPEARNRQGQAGQAAPGNSGNSNLGNQLNNDAQSRNRGNQLDQQNRSGGGGRFGGGSGGGGRFGGGSGGASGGGGGRRR